MERLKNKWQCKIAILTNLAISLDTTQFDCGENQPWRTVTEGKCPTANDDPLCSGNGTDILKYSNIFITHHSWLMCICFGLMERRSVFHLKKGVKFEFFQVPMWYLFFYILLEINRWNIKMKVLENRMTEWL